MSDPAVGPPAEDTGEPVVPPRPGSLPYLDAGVINTQGAEEHMPFGDVLGWTAVFFHDTNAVSPPAWYVADHPGCWLHLAAGFTAAEIMSGTVPDEDTARALAALRGYDLGADEQTT